MRYTLERTRQAVQAINVACCLLFFLLGYVYLYFFQGDLMSMAQHILSHGRTTYYIGLYTFIIVSVLLMIGVIISRCVYLPIRARALAWFPSCWILGLMTRVSLQIPGVPSNPVSLWWFILGVLLYLCCLLIARLYNQNRNENSSFSALLWPNLALLSLSFSFIFATGNTNRRIHNELRLEQLAQNGEFDDVIKMTSNETELSRPMMYLRAYALSKQDRLGDELFCHPNLLDSDALLPQLVDSLRPCNIPAVLRQHLGGMPLHDMSTTNFLRFITADSTCTSTSRQYLLSALLLDRNLGEFRDSLVAFYVPNDTLSALVEKKNSRPWWAKKSTNEVKTITLPSLPQHYAEALTLANTTLSREFTYIYNQTKLELVLEYADSTNLTDYYKKYFYRND